MGPVGFACWLEQVVAEKMVENCDAEFEKFVVFTQVIPDDRSR